MTATCKITRLRFKYDFRRCKLLDETARADAMAKSCNSREVWNNVEASKKCSIPLATKVSN